MVPEKNNPRAGVHCAPKTLFLNVSATSSTTADLGTAKPCALNADEPDRTLAVREQRLRR
jgi:hypothetical protein